MNRTNAKDRKTNKMAKEQTATKILKATIPTPSNNNMRKKLSIKMSAKNRKI